MAHPAAVSGTPSLTTLLDTLSAAPTGIVGKAQPVTTTESTGMTPTTKYILIGIGGVLLLLLLLAMLSKCINKGKPKHYTYYDQYGQPN
ncbi:hypothetical protein GGH92_010394 [Coemansia sp. RSA 2673]|nr:hypothetical protein GGH92_010394 [Coemansia sp. RSA 2673]